LNCLEHAAGDSRQCIEAIVRSLNTRIEINPHGASFIYAHIIRSGASSAEPILEINRKYKQVIEYLVGPLIISGQVRSLPTDYWSSLIVAPVHNQARRWLCSQVQHSPAAHCQVLLMLLGALFSRTDLILTLHKLRIQTLLED